MSIKRIIEVYRPNNFIYLDQIGTKLPCQQFSDVVRADERLSARHDIIVSERDDFYSCKAYGKIHSNKRLVFDSRLQKELYFGTAG